MKEYDLIVIGSGGGLQISSQAWKLGKKVAVIEKGRMGGTCLNRGCIPSKMLIHPANVASVIGKSTKYDINSAIKSINLPGIIQRINRTINRESNQLKSWYQQPHSRLTFYEGHARFLNNRIIEVNGQKITGKRIYLATGASPFTPPIPGLDQTPYWTSTEALQSKIKPKKLLIIGGGYIACEIGYAYSALGTNVNWLVRNHSLLTREDYQVSETFTKLFSQREKVYLGVKVTKVEYAHDVFSLHLLFDQGKKSIISGDALLVATGITPNTVELGLENTDIKTDPNGFIKVNTYLETNVKDVYALGDVVGNYFFRHAVNFEAQFLLRTHYLENRKKTISYLPMPHAVFTNPEIASVGATEQELIKNHIPYVSGFDIYENSAMGQARLSKSEFVKLLFHKKTRKLLGAHILGDEASTMIHQLVYAITFKATAEDLLNMIYIHPALPEVVRNAVRIAYDKF